MCICLLIFGFETKKEGVILTKKKTVRPLKFKLKLHQNCQSV